MKSFRLFAVMAAQYAIITMNIRYIGHGTYTGAIVTDTLIATAGWTVTRWVVAATSWQERAGYVLGASLGSAIGIWLT